MVLKDQFAAYWAAGCAFRALQLIDGADGLSEAEQVWIEQFMVEMQQYGHHPAHRGLTYYHIMAQVARRLPKPPPRLQLIAEALGLPHESSSGDGFPLASTSVIYMLEFIGELLGEHEREVFDQWRHEQLGRVKAEIRAVVERMATRGFRHETRQQLGLSLDVQGHLVYRTEEPFYTYDYDWCVHFVAKLSLPIPTEDLSGREEILRYRFCMN